MSSYQKNGTRRKPLVQLGANYSDCWLWTGYINKQTGYGKKQWHGRSELAHRWIWTMLFGEIPEGGVINHLCSNRACVNPHHLEITDQAGNCRHGKGTKLNTEQVRHIRAALRTRKWGGTRKELAQRYGVTEVTISDIWCRRSWKEIQP